MAKALNKKRMLGSKIAVLASISIVFLSRQYWTEENMYHEVFELIGITLTSICAMGRIYSTAFLGGHKNETLITHGIYSVLRNPVYFFTLLGITGVAFMSNHISVMIGLPIFFFMMYSQLINRKQEFLLQKFGNEYRQYSQSTYALWPNFSNYTAPDVIDLNPRYLTKSILDAVWWLAALPIIELSEYLHTQHILPTFFVG